MITKAPDPTDMYWSALAFQGAIIDNFTFALKFSRPSTLKPNVANAKL